MKIHSNFKDYYDYVEYLYSPEGGDKSLPLYRSKLDKSLEWYQLVGLEVPAVPIRRLPQPLPPWRGGRDDFPWRLKWCVVCGKYYLLAAKKNDKERWEESTTYKPFRLVTENHPVFEDLYYSPFTTGRSSDGVIAEDILGYPGELPDPVLVSLSQKIGSPMFVIHSVHGPHSYSPTPVPKGRTLIQFENLVPNLGHLGFASLIAPERMYQELSMFLGNVMRDPPDSAPPVSVSDKDRLVQKGFDLKTSFRGKTK